MEFEELVGNEELLEELEEKTGREKEQEEYIEEYIEDEPLKLALEEQDDDDQNIGMDYSTMRGLNIHVLRTPDDQVLIRMEICKMALNNNVDKNILSDIFSLAQSKFGSRLTWVNADALVMGGLWIKGKNKLTAKHLNKFFNAHHVTYKDIDGSNKDLVTKEDLLRYIRVLS